MNNFLSKKLFKKSMFFIENDRHKNKFFGDKYNNIKTVIVF